MVRRLILAFIACAMATGPAFAQVATPDMVGHWKGDAEIFSNWTKARTLAVDIRISSDDKVTGTIGDAQLIDGKLLSNRGWLGRAIRVRTDYRIAAGLAGKVIAAEDVERSNVSLPLNLLGGALRGSVQTSGTKVGGPAGGILTAGRLVLRRVPETMLCQPEPMPCPRGGMMSGKPPRLHR